MTRKDYVLLAEALNNAQPLLPGERGSERDEHLTEGVCLAARAVAHALAQDNRAFDRGRFLRAAGVQS